MPGRRTRPVTSTTTLARAAGAAEAPAAARAPSGVASAARVVVSATGAGTSCAPLRTSHQQVTANPSAATTASTASWPGPSAMRPRS